MEGPARTFGSVSNGSRPDSDRQGLDFRRVADCVPGCILVADANGKVLYANKGFVATMGRPLEELLGEGWLQSVDPEFIEQAKAEWYECIQKRERLDVTWRFHTQDGTLRWQHLRAEPSRHDEKGHVCWYLLGVDVDEQFKAREALQASEREAREILDRLPAMISIRTEEGVAYTNKRLSDYVGAVITDLRDGSYLDYTHPDDRPAMVTEHIKSPNKGPNDIIYRLRGKDGIYRWFHTRAEPYFNPDGSIYRWYALNSDIDALYRSRELLREREFQLNLLTETLPAVLWKADLNGHITFINKETIWSISQDGNTALMNKVARDPSERTLEEIQSGQWLENIHPDDRAAFSQELAKSLSSGNSFATEHRLKGQDGNWRWFLCRAEPSRDDHGKVVRWFGVTLDIHDRKLAESRLRELRSNLSRTSRASIVSEICASIAHELNQPLSSLLSNAQASLRWLNAETPNIENAVISIERVVRDGRAADAAIRNIRSLYKQQPTVRASFNMVELLGEVIGLLKEDASRRSTLIEYEFEAPALEVLVDRYQIQQIIINLVTNAIDAMRDIDREPLLFIRIRHAERGRVLTEFVDNGHGLPEDGAEKIFDAFVSTKENGMGIGLAISRSIVEAHEGELWASNNPGFGATFSLLLKGPDASEG